MVYLLLLYFLLLTQSTKLKPKFCLNCKYLLRDNNDDTINGKCKKFPYVKNPKYLVSGDEKNMEYFFCSTARSHENMCGTDATQYSPMRKKKST